MHDVVEMLLTRIKDYPEDFVIDPEGYRLGKYVEPTKWSQALQTAKEVMTEEERVVIDDAMEMAKRAIYMGAALKTIMSDDVREEAGMMTMKSTGRYNYQSGWVDPNTALSIQNTPLAHSIQIGNAQLTEDKINLITELQQRQKAAEIKMADAVFKQELKKYATNNA